MMHTTPEEQSAAIWGTLPGDQIPSFTVRLWFSEDRRAWFGGHSFLWALMFAIEQSYEAFLIGHGLRKSRHDATIDALDALTESFIQASKAFEQFGRALRESPAS